MVISCSRSTATRSAHVPTGSAGTTRCPATGSISWATTRSRSSRWACHFTLRSLPGHTEGADNVITFTISEDGSLSRSRPAAPPIVASWVRASSRPLSGTPLLRTSRRSESSPPESKRSRRLAGDSHRGRLLRVPSPSAQRARLATAHSARPHPAPSQHSPNPGGIRRLHSAATQRSTEEPLARLGAMPSVRSPRLVRVRRPWAFDRRATYRRLDRGRGRPSPDARLTLASRGIRRSGASSSLDDDVSKRPRERLPGRSGRPAREWTLGPRSLLSLTVGCLDSDDPHAREVVGVPGTRE